MNCVKLWWLINVCGDGMMRQKWLLGVITPPSTNQANAAANYPILYPTTAKLYIWCITTCNHCYTFLNNTQNYYWSHRQTKFAQWQYKYILKTNETIICKIVSCLHRLVFPQNEEIDLERDICENCYHRILKLFCALKLFCSCSVLTSVTYSSQLNTLVLFHITCTKSHCTIPVSRTYHIWDETKY